LIAYSGVILITYHYQCVSTGFNLTTVVLLLGRLL